MTEGSGLTLRQLRYFVGAARTLSLMKASYSLNVSQPALSLQIKRLEVCLGTSLFERQARGLKLTAAGTVFLAHAIDVLEAVKIAERSVSHRDPVRSVALGLTPTIGRALVGDLVSGASSGTVALKLSLREALSDELTSLFRAGELEAVLCYDQKPDAATEMIPLYAEALHLVGPPSELFSGCKSQVPVAELSKFPLALAPPDHESRRLIEHAAATGGVALDVRLEITPASLKRELLIRHRFYTIVPFGLFLPEVRAGQLVAVRILPEIVRTMSLLMSKNLSSHVRRRLVEFTRAAVDVTIAKRQFRWQSLDNGRGPLIK